MTGSEPWFVAEAGPEAKKYAPATLRNRDAIVDVLRGILPETGLVLEIASGSGEHIVHFAHAFPKLDWQPSDPDAEARRSIAAWTAESGLAHIRPPIDLDAAAPDWPIARADAILCINMIHISPWAATEGLIAGAARLLSPGGVLYLYGPFIRAGVETAESNLAFDVSLKSRDAEWGIRALEDVTMLAAGQGLRLDQVEEMAANNLSVAFRREDRRRD
ncbi:DUF938 domain-containing protein [Sphingobium boeckii]|uniref:SAM-dependent methyltransferase n=1 Tax=Sphingobium boeckii TaxID=1082345 RepID=A0A7W9EFB8_9SPHN|nr:SAM-dependent methyltransferase [Sphingobium boeckii]